MFAGDISNIIVSGEYMYIEYRSYGFVVSVTLWRVASSAASGEFDSE